MNGLHSNHSNPPFTEHVDHNFVPPPPTSPTKTLLLTSIQTDAVFRTEEPKRIKLCLRENQWPANHEIRKVLWSKFYKIRLKEYQSDHEASIYQDVVKEVFGDGHIMFDVPLPSFINPTEMLHYHLNEHGIHIVKKIICVIGNTNPDITYSPTLVALTSLLLHYMNEEDCFNYMHELLQHHREGSHITQTKMSHEASKYVLRDLAKKYAKPAYALMRQSKNVESVLDDWVWWIFRDLPYSYLVRVIDCYLFEGPKILYRVALAILILFHKHTVKRSPTRTLDTSPAGLAAAISTFCDDLPVSIDKLLKTAFGIRGFKRKEVKKLTVKNEMYLKSRIHVAAMPHMTKSASCESLTLKVSRSFSGPMSMQNVDSTFLNRDQSHHGTYPRSRSRSLQLGVSAPLDLVSSILTYNDLQTIWRWIPPRVTLYQADVVYTTEEHGTSLKTLYHHCEPFEQTLLLIRTVRNEIFGAYLSTSWEERLTSGSKSLSYFGTGETFLFTLYPERRKFEWVGIRHAQNIPRSAHMFMAGNFGKLTIGGGNGEGLQLDEELFLGRTDECDTFNNDPLCAGRDFECSCVEVIAFFPDHG